MNGATYGCTSGSRDWHRRSRGRCAYRSYQCEHLLIIDEPRGVFDRSFRFVCVVPESEFKPPAVNSTISVGLVKRGEDPCPHSQSKLRGGTAECRGLAEEDYVVRYTVAAAGDVLTRTSSWLRNFEPRCGFLRIFRTGTVLGYCWCIRTISAAWRLQSPRLLRPTLRHGIQGW